ncbi:MAG: energy transducer TonB [Bacteroidia bacterium]|nr:energy transducer TonB [Bacteroidia bacterium]MDW8416035.1 energy transducer TonB [Bacteroidia bacterium]
MSTYHQDESRARRISAVVTILFFIAWLIIAYFWVLLRGTIPPEDENPYIVAGMIDFGYTETVGTVKPSQESAKPSETVITTQEQSPVQSPSADNSPQPVTSETSTSNTSESTNEESDEEVENEVFQPGGSPDASEAGDLGRGLLEFGEGDEGTAERRLIYFVAPKYTVQKEARVRFELFVLPDGRVSHARAIDLQAPPELKRAGEEAILQWRFNPISRNQIVRMTVRIRFKLR